LSQTLAVLAPALPPVCRVDVVPRDPETLDRASDAAVQMWLADVLEALRTAWSDIAVAAAPAVGSARPALVWDLAVMEEERPGYLMPDGRVVRVRLAAVLQGPSNDGVLARGWLSQVLFIRPGEARPYPLGEPTLEMTVLRPLHADPC
jgi:hypothetical protein